MSRHNNFNLHLANLSKQQEQQISQQQQQQQQHSRRNSSAGPRHGRQLEGSQSLQINLAALCCLWALLVASISAGGPVAALAKPLNQNQVKFRRLPPKEFTAALGSSVTIECEAGGSPPPTIHWLKDGKRIVQNDADDNQLYDGQPVQVDNVNRIALSSTRSRLFIDCTGFQDEAVYTCVAENAYSRIATHTKLNLIRPLPQAPAAAGSEDNLLPATLEEMAAIELAVAAGGAKAAEQQQPGAELTSGSDGQSLSAVSQCLNQRNSRSIAEPVRIHMWTHNIVELMNNNIILYCRSNVKRQQLANAQQQQSQSQDAATSSDLSSNKLKLSAPIEQQLDNTSNIKKSSYVSWTLPNEKLVDADQKDRYEILETGDLLVKNLQWSDMGNFVCTVSDEQGSDSISTFVYPAAVKAASVNKRAILSTSSSANNNNNQRSKIKVRKQARF